MLLPGREGRLSEPAISRLLPLVEALGSALQPWLDLPFVFFGHSMGALLAFELARRLRGLYAIEPRQLFLSGNAAPQVPDLNPPRHALPEAEFLAELRRLNGTPEAVLQHRELMELMLPILRADFAVCETYVYTPQPLLACPIAAFGGLDDPEIRRDALAAWAEQTQGAFRLRMLPGDHFFLTGARPLLLWAVAHDLLRVLRSLPTA